MARCLIPASLVGLRRQQPTSTRQLSWTEGTVADVKVLSSVINIVVRLLYAVTVAATPPPRSARPPPPRRLRSLQFHPRPSSLKPPARSRTRSPR